jgi:D-sedoheptulose 7-phosphate isomerase
MSRTTKSRGLTPRVQDGLARRNTLSEAFFAREAGRLAVACQEMADRFLRAGRLLALGRGPYATDAQHVSVEFAHPEIVGRRALPALDLSIGGPASMSAILNADDMVMGFGPPGGDPEIRDALDAARARGAMTFALPGQRGSYAADAITDHPFIHQEILEILYHTLWETVHVFFEPREAGAGVQAGVRDPLAGRGGQAVSDAVADVTASIRMKAAEAVTLREQVALEQADALCDAARGIRRCIARGGKLIVFGNGGSATAANDLAIDCVAPPTGYRPIPAISLSSQPAQLTAIANDVGADVVFLRQLVVHASKHDIAMAMSTSGGSSNIAAALAEARARGLVTIALLGQDGGDVARRRLSDVSLIVPSDSIPRIQEIHASMYHIVRELLEVRDDC